MKISVDFDRLLRRSLVVIAVGGLAIGAAARLAGYGSLDNQFWFAATVPVAAGLAYSIVRDLAAGRMGVDAIALVSMLGALGLGQPLAGAVIALMYSGGNLLEDFAVGRAERDLSALIDRAPRLAHRRRDLPRRRCAGREDRGLGHNSGSRRRSRPRRRHYHFARGYDRRGGADRRAPAGRGVRGDSVCSGTINAGEN